VLKTSGVVSTGLATLILCAGGPAIDGPQNAPRGSPTFSADVAPLIHARCTECHRPGQAAPFPLMSYEDVRSRGPSIVEMTASHAMPPWLPAQGEGLAALQTPRTLNGAEISLLRRWVEAGMPPGDPARTPAPPSFPTGWPLGLPDVTLTLPRSITVPAAGPEYSRRIFITMGLSEDRLIRAIDYRPTARAAVREVLFFVEHADGLPQADELPGLTRLLDAARMPAEAWRLSALDDLAGGLSTWVPGVPERAWPPDAGMVLPRFSNLVMQIRFRPTSRAEIEDGQIAIYFATGDRLAPLAGLQLPPAMGYAAGIDLEAGAARVRVGDSFELPIGLTARGVRGYAHSLGRRMRLTARLPDGAVRGLLSIEDWNPAWQEDYALTAPVQLPAGTRLDAEIVFDNSTSHPRRLLSPPQRITWGMGPPSERAGITLVIDAPSASDTRALLAAYARHFSQQLLNSRK